MDTQSYKRLPMVTKRYPGISGISGSIRIRKSLSYCIALGNLNFKLKLKPKTHFYKVLQDYPRVVKVTQCRPDSKALHELACSFISLHAVLWACMLFHELTFTSMSLHALPWACMHFHELASSYISLHPVQRACIHFKKLASTSKSLHGVPWVCMEYHDLTFMH